MLGLYLPPVFKTASSHQKGYRPTRSFHCRSTLPCDACRAARRVGRASGRPTVRAGIVSAAGVQLVAAESITISAPHDHFTATPHCLCEGLGQTGAFVGAGCCPTIGAGIISAPGVQLHTGKYATSTPDDHFAAGPDCRVLSTGQLRRIDGRWWLSNYRSPGCICRRCSNRDMPPLRPPQTIISLPVQTAARDRFCRNGRVGDAGSSPRVIICT